MFLMPAPPPSVEGGAIGYYPTDNVIFHDPMPRPNLLKRIQEADVCIFPSLFENWPNTCIEAMSAGRVVIGSKHGGMGEMIEDGVSGFHVDGRSSADIVRVFNDRGACLAGIELSDQLRPGVIELPTGAWFDPQLVEGVELDVHGNPNAVTPDKGTSSLAQGCSAHS